jgi:hypothetical protein
MHARRSANRLRIPAAVLGAAALILVPTACGGDDEPEGSDSVTARGTVTEVVSPLSFEVSDSSEAELVVAALETTPPSFGVGDELVVTGVLTEFDEDELQEAFAVDLDPDLHEDYEGEMVLVATQITTDDEGP